MMGPSESSDGLLRLAGALVTATAACGDLESAAGPEQAVFVLTARLQGGGVPAAAGEYRTLVQWLSIGSGAGVRCLETGPPAECPTSAVDTDLRLEERALVATVGGFELALSGFPSERQLLSHGDGARLAFASVALYDDVDLDGALTGADSVVAESVYGGQVSMIVFREGPIHPYDAIVRERYGCSAPPLGYSALRIDRGLTCRVTPITPILVAPRAGLEPADMRCGGPVISMVDPPEEPPVVAPGLPRRLACLPGNRARVFVDRGGPCDQTDGVAVFALAGCRDGRRDCWNLVATPPDWWPCPIEMAP